MKKKLLSNMVVLVIIAATSLWVTAISGSSSGRRFAAHSLQPEPAARKIRALHSLGITSWGMRGAIPFSPDLKLPVGDLDIIRKRIIDDLLEPAIKPNEITQAMKSIRQDGSWPGINYKDTSRTGFEHSHHLENMLELSRAYKKSGSEFYKKPELKKVISSSLDFWIDHDFICENWWWNEMGTPNMMINILLVMDTDLTENQRTQGARIANRANLKASGARPGGDLIQIAGMLGKQGLFARNEEVLEQVVKVMAEQIKVTTGRGLKPISRENPVIEQLFSQ